MKNYNGLVALFLIISIAIQLQIVLSSKIQAKQFIDNNSYKYNQYYQNGPSQFQDYDATSSNYYSSLLNNYRDLEYYNWSPIGSFEKPGLSMPVLKKSCVNCSLRRNNSKINKMKDASFNYIKPILSQPQLLIRPKPLLRTISTNLYNRNGHGSLDSKKKEELALLAERDVADLSTNMEEINAKIDKIDYLDTKQLLGSIIII